MKFRFVIDMASLGRLWPGAKRAELICVSRNPGLDGRAVDNILLARKREAAAMKQYLDLLSHVLDNGSDRGDRTGTGTRSVFGYRMRFDLSKGFPVTTTKKLHLKSIIHELLWFLRGDTNIAYLKDNGVSALPALRRYLSWRA